MSDAVVVALTAGSLNIIAIIVSRLLSRFEHHATQTDIKYIKEYITNGKTNDT